VPVRRRLTTTFKRTSGLQRPGWREANEALLARAAVKKNYVRLPAWFAAHGGPGDRAQLADRLERKNQYEILYRSWSETTHAGDVEELLKRDSQPG